MKTLRREFKNCKGNLVRIYNCEGFLQVVKVVERCEMILEMGAKNFYTTFGYMDSVTEANAYAEFI